uniref:Uncharacterized protein n=1 Tax=Trichuris muris TaxID=70415 RepID=A0A5S6QY48_TRIMR
MSVVQRKTVDYPFGLARGVCNHVSRPYLWQMGEFITFGTRLFRKLRFRKLVHLFGVVYFSLPAACSSASFDSECSTCAYPSILKGLTENPRGYNSKAKEAVAHQSERQVFEGLTALALIRGPSNLKRVRHVRA